jgi:hypothetical protein
MWSSSPSPRRSSAVTGTIRAGPTDGTGVRAGADGAPTRTRRRRPAEAERLRSPGSGGLVTGRRGRGRTAHL